MATNGDSTCLVNSCALTDSVVQTLENGSAHHKRGPTRAPPPPPPPKPMAIKSPLQTSNPAQVAAASPNPQQTQQKSGQDSSACADPHLPSTTTGTRPNHPSPHTQSASSDHSSLTSAEFPNEVVNSKINSAGTSKPTASMASKTPSSGSPAGVVHTPDNELLFPRESLGGVKTDRLNGAVCHGGAEGGVRIEVSHEQNGHQNGTNTRLHTRTPSYTHALTYVGSDLGHRAAGHVRGAFDASSRSDVGSPGSEASQDHASSSSSLSHDASSLSHDNSFASRTLLLERLKSELCQQRTASDPTLRASAEQSNAEFVQQLLETIVSLKMELASLREENESLKQVRTNMDDELHTLTENLFEEAYKMVDDAKGGKVVAEKRLADAAGKIDAMETEMSALKNLLDAPPDKHTLNPHHHHHHKHRRPSVKKVLRKITKKAGVGRGSPSSKHKHHSVTQLRHRSETKGAMLVEGEPVQEDCDAFCRWIEELKVGGAQDHAYLWSVVATDVRPCLAFRNTELSEQVLHAVEQNHLLMESLSSTAEEERVCALSGSGNGLCTHRLQLGDSAHWHHISQQARNRIVAACDFYMYISHVKNGIIKLDASQLYWQVARLRALMALARLNLSLPEEKPPQ